MVHRVACMPPAPGSTLRSWSIAGGAVVVWLMVLLAGSDWQPPTGFWWSLVVAVPHAMVAAEREQGASAAGPPGFLAPSQLPD